ncbi:MAG: NAD-dependent epimerase/dehydratase family protein [Deltaproteobacteria bacterium]|nr:NAD-dependent epimerase/dehydratase family protein [Deltaproteobacteria bacterium]
MKHRSIAITGTTGFIGKMLLEALSSRKRGPRCLAIDRLPPPITAPRVEGIDCDLTAPYANEHLAEILRRHQCDLVVHAALHSQPKRHEEYSHELQSIGTMHLLHAVNAAKIRKVILSSTTEVYGAFPDNPNFLSETHPLRGGSLSAFLRDKIDVEEQVATFARQHPHSVVTIMRPCTILGPKIRNYKTHLLKKPVIPTVLGFDPLVQYVHENDVLRAFLLAIEKDAAGAFNIVGDGVLPLSRALATVGKVRIPLPRAVLWNTFQTLWHLNLQPTPPSHIHFLQYPCIADGEKAKKALAFHPVYSLQEVLFSFQEGQGHDDTTEDTAASDSA